MSIYNIIAASNESTVVAEYTPESSRSDSFQSEAALEKEFIRLLTTQGYEHLMVMLTVMIFTSNAVVKEMFGL